MHISDVALLVDLIHISRNNTVRDSETHAKPIDDESLSQTLPGTIRHANATNKPKDHVASNLEVTNLS